MEKLTLRKFDDFEAVEISEMAKAFGGAIDGTTHDTYNTHINTSTWLGFDNEQVIAKDCDPDQSVAGKSPTRRD